MNESEQDQTARELLELLNEIRVILPSVSTLFAFMLAVPFTQRFDRINEFDRYVFFAGFLCAAFSVAFLTVPSVYHRLHWRRDVRDKDQMLRTSNRLSILGVVFMALSMIATVYVVTRSVFSRVPTLIATGAVAAAMVWLWFLLPMSRRAKERAGRLTRP